MLDVPPWLRDGSWNLDPISGSLTWVDVPAAPLRPLVDDIFDPQPSSLPRLLVVVLSAATRDATMRQRQRKVCKSLYDRRPNVDMVFAVGVPLTKAQSVSSHAQGLKATEDEQRWSAQLITKTGLRVLVRHERSRAALITRVMLSSTVSGFQRPCGKRC